MIVNNVRKIYYPYYYSFKIIPLYIAFTGDKPLKAAQRIDFFFTFHLCAKTLKLHLTAHI